MVSNTVYIALDQSVLVTNKKVCIGDISSIYCVDNKIRNQISNILLFTFSEEEINQKVVTAMKIIESISLQIPDASINLIGSTETICYYKNLSPKTKVSTLIKTAFLFILAFFGTAYSIMSYNGDVGAIDLLKNIYKLSTGNEATNSNPWFALGLLTYSLGLCIGMIVFFNHGINKKHIDDPTPLQVQMRLYEQDVNNTIAINSTRNKTSLDI